MSTSRRRFLTTSTTLTGVGLTGLLLPESADAAFAAQSRVFQSDWRLRKIALQLVLGIGYQLGQAINVENIERLTTDGYFFAKLQTLREKALHERETIDVTIDQAKLFLNGVRITQDQRTRVKDFLKSIAQDLAAAAQDRRFEAGEFIQILSRISAKLREYMAKYHEVRLEYRITYKQVELYKSTMISKGHVRLQAHIRKPVRCLNCLDFVIDAKECNEQTTITTMLGVDYNVGRREGLLVRRSAQKRIAEREAFLLCNLEEIVYGVIHRERDQADLRRIIPELLRRVEEMDA